MASGSRRGGLKGSARGLYRRVSARRRAQVAQRRSGYDDYGHDYDGPTHRPRWGSPLLVLVLILAGVVGALLTVLLLVLP